MVMDIPRWVTIRLATIRWVTIRSVIMEVRGGRMVWEVGFVRTVLETDIARFTDRAFFPSAHSLFTLPSTHRIHPFMHRIIHPIIMRRYTTVRW